MAYCTREDIEFVYGIVTVKDWADVDGTDDPANITARIDRMIEKADNIIDGKLRRRNFVIPFAVTPGVVRDISADLAGYNLYAARMLDGGDRTKDNLSHKKKEAMQALHDIVAGNIILDVELQDYTDAPSVAKS